MNPVFTVGYSIHDKEHFLKLLRKHGIRTVVDVRSNPYSKHVSRFNRDRLQGFLTARGIRYVYAGGALGGSPREKELHAKDGKTGHRKTAGAKRFQDKMERIIEEAERTRLCLLCAENDPEKRHRTLLAGHELHLRGIEVRHIIAEDGPASPHAEILAKLSRRQRTDKPPTKAERPEKPAEHRRE